MLKKFLLCLLAVTLIFASFAQAEDAAPVALTVQEVSTQMGENSVRYPQLQGMADETIQQTINNDIVVASGVTNYMVSLFTLTPQQSLKVDYDAWLSEEVFSVIVSAKGKLPMKRDGHAYTALTYDLATGERLTLDALFNDVDAAVAYMEEQVTESLAEELNGYLEYSELTPLPVDAFTLDERGITFWYPAEQFAFGSGYSGACQFWYEELEGFWLEENVPAMTAQQQKENVEMAVAEGSLPNVPVEMGQNMQQVADEFRLLRTPDEFPGGRYFVFEHPALRGILIISDSIQQEYADSKVEGVQLRRGSLGGFVIGKAQRAEWLEVLGAPETTVVMSANMAYDYALCEGQYDVYRYGDHQLRLYSDTDGILFAIQISK